MNRVTTQVQPERLLLGPQSCAIIPVLVRHHQFGTRLFGLAKTEKIILPRILISVKLVASLQGTWQVFPQARPVRPEMIGSTRLDQRFQHAFVDGTGVCASTEIIECFKRTVLITGFEHTRQCSFTDTFDCT